MKSCSRCPAAARVVVYRRLMLRIAEALARRTGALALVTGESVGQVASQTLHNLARVDEVADLPVLRPLIGMDKLEITAQAQAHRHLRDLHRAGRRLLHPLRAQAPGHAHEPRGSPRVGEPPRHPAPSSPRAWRAPSLEVFDFPAGAGPLRPMPARAGPRAREEPRGR